MRRCHLGNRTARKIALSPLVPFAKQKFLSDLKDGIKNAKSAHNVTNTVVIDIADGNTGEVMESISQ